MGTYARELNKNVDLKSDQSNLTDLNVLSNLAYGFQNDLNNTLQEDFNVAKVQRELGVFSVDLKLKLFAFLNYYCGNSISVKEIVSENKKTFDVLKGYLDGDLVNPSKSETDIVISFLTYVSHRPENTLLKLNSKDIDQLSKAIESLTDVVDNEATSDDVLRKNSKSELGISTREQFYRNQAYLFDYDNKTVSKVVADLYSEGVLNDLMSETEVLVAILDYIQDTITYEEDVSGTDEWQSLNETLSKKTGDCEDLVIAQLVLLSNVFKSKFGYSKQDVAKAFSLSAGYIQLPFDIQEGHAILNVQLKSEPNPLFVDATYSGGFVDPAVIEFETVFEMNNSTFNKFQFVQDHYSTAAGRRPLASDWTRGPFGYGSSYFYSEDRSMRSFDLSHKNFYNNVRNSMRGGKIIPKFGDDLPYTLTDYYAKRSSLIAGDGGFGMPEAMPIEFKNKILRGVPGATLEYLAQAYNHKSFISRINNIIRNISEVIGQSSEIPALYEGSLYRKIDFDPLKDIQDGDEFKIKNVIEFDALYQKKVGEILGEIGTENLDEAQQYIQFLSELQLAIDERKTEVNLFGKEKLLAFNSAYSAYTTERDAFIETLNGFIDQNIYDVFHYDVGEGAFQTVELIKWDEQKQEVATVSIKEYVGKPKEFLESVIEALQDGYYFKNSSKFIERNKARYKKLSDTSQTYNADTNQFFIKQFLEFMTATDLVQRSVNESFHTQGLLSNGVITLNSIETMLGSNNKNKALQIWEYLIRNGYITESVGGFVVDENNNGMPDEVDSSGNSKRVAHFVIDTAYKKEDDGSISYDSKKFKNGIRLFWAEFQEGDDYSGDAEDMDELLGINWNDLKEEIDLSGDKLKALKDLFFKPNFDNDTGFSVHGFDAFKDGKFTADDNQQKISWYGLGLEAQLQVLSKEISANDSELNTKTDMQEAPTWIAKTSSGFVNIDNLRLAAVLMSNRKFKEQQFDLHKQIVGSQQKNLTFKDDADKLNNLIQIKNLRNQYENLESKIQPIYRLIDQSILVTAETSQNNKNEIIGWKSETIGFQGDPNIKYETPYTFFDIHVDKVDQLEVFSDLETEVEASTIMQGLAVREDAFYRYSGSISKYFNYLLLLFHMVNHFEELSVQVSREVHDSYLDENEKDSMKRIRDRGDKAFNNFNRVLSKTQSMVSSGVSQLSNEIFEFVKSTNTAMKAQKELYIENWNRTVVSDDRVGGLIASFLFGGITEFVDQLTGAFSLVRSQMKVKVNSFFFRISTLNSIASTTLSRLILSGYDEKNYRFYTRHYFNENDNINPHHDDIKHGLFSKGTTTHVGSKGISLISDELDVATNENYLSKYFGRTYNSDGSRFTSASAEETMIKQVFGDNDLPGLGSKRILQNMLNSLFKYGNTDRAKPLYGVFEEGEKFLYDTAGLEASDQTIQGQIVDFYDRYMNELSNTSTVTYSEKDMKNLQLLTIDKKGPILSNQDNKVDDFQPIFHSDYNRDPFASIEAVGDLDTPDSDENPAITFIMKIVNGLLKVVTEPVKLLAKASADGIFDLLIGDQIDLKQFFADYDYNFINQMRRYIYHFQVQTYVTLLVTLTIFEKRLEESREFSDNVGHKKLTVSTNQGRKAVEQSLEAELELFKTSFNQLHEYNVSLNDAANNLTKARIDNLKSFQLMRAKSIKTAAELGVFGAAWIAAPSITAYIHAQNVAMFGALTPLIVFPGIGDPGYWTTAINTSANAFLENQFSKFEYNLEKRFENFPNPITMVGTYQSNNYISDITKNSKGFSIIPGNFDYKSTNSIYTKLTDSQNLAHPLTMMSQDDYDDLIPDTEKKYGERHKDLSERLHTYYFSNTPTTLGHLEEFRRNDLNTLKSLYPTFDAFYKSKFNGNDSSSYNLGLNRYSINIKNHVDTSLMKMLYHNRLRYNSPVNFTVTLGGSKTGFMQNKMRVNGILKKDEKDKFSPVVGGFWDAASDGRSNSQLPLDEISGSSFFANRGDSTFVQNGLYAAYVSQMSTKTLALMKLQLMIIRAIMSAIEAVVSDMFGKQKPDAMSRFDGSNGFNILDSFLNVERELISDFKAENQIQMAAWSESMMKKKDLDRKYMDTLYKMFELGASGAIWAGLYGEQILNLSNLFIDTFKTNRDYGWGPFSPVWNFYHHDEPYRARRFKEILKGIDNEFIISPENSKLHSAPFAEDVKDTESLIFDENIAPFYDNSKKSSVDGFIGDHKKSISELKNQYKSTRSLQNEKFQPKSYQGGINALRIQNNLFKNKNMNFAYNLTDLYRPADHYVSRWNIVERQFDFYDSLESGLLRSFGDLDYNYNSKSNYTWYKSISPNEIKSGVDFEKNTNEVSINDNYPDAKLPFYLFDDPIYRDLFLQKTALSDQNPDHEGIVSLDIKMEERKVVIENYWDQRTNEEVKQKRFLLKTKNNDSQHFQPITDATEGSMEGWTKITNPIDFLNLQKKMTHLFMMRSLFLMFEQAIHDQKQNQLREMFGYNIDSGVIANLMGIVDSHNSNQREVMENFLQEHGSIMASYNERKAAEKTLIVENSVNAAFALFITAGRRLMSYAVGDKSEEIRDAISMIVRFSKARSGLIATTKFAMSLATLMGALNRAQSLTKEIIQYSEKEEEGEEKEEDTSEAGKRGKEIDNIQKEGHKQDLKSLTPDKTMKLNARGGITVNKAALAKAKSRAKKRFRKIELLQKLNDAERDAILDEMAEISGLSASSARRGISGIINQQKQSELKSLDTVFNASKNIANIADQALQEVRQATMQGVMVAMEQSKARTMKNREKRAESNKDRGKEKNKSSKAKKAFGHLYNTATGFSISSVVDNLGRGTRKVLDTAKSVLTSNKSKNDLSQTKQFAKNGSDQFREKKYMKFLNQVDHYMSPLMAMVISDAMIAAGAKSIMENEAEEVAGEDEGEGVELVYGYGGMGDGFVEVAQHDYPGDQDQDQDKDKDKDSRSDSGGIQGLGNAEVQDLEFNDIQFSDYAFDSDRTWAVGMDPNEAENLVSSDNFIDLSMFESVPSLSNFADTSDLENAILMAEITQGNIELMKKLIQDSMLAQKALASKLKQDFMPKWDSSDKLIDEKTGRLKSDKDIDSKGFMKRMMLKHLKNKVLEVEKTENRQQRLQKNFQNDTFKNQLTNMLTELSQVSDTAQNHTKDILQYVAEGNHDLAMKELDAVRREHSSDIEVLRHINKIAGTINSATRADYQQGYGLSSWLGVDAKLKENPSFAGATFDSMAATGGAGIGFSAGITFALSAPGGVFAAPILGLIGAGVGAFAGRYLRNPFALRHYFLGKPRHTADHQAPSSQPLGSLVSPGISTTPSLTAPGMFSASPTSATVGGSGFGSASASSTGSTTSSTASVPAAATEKQKPSTDMYGKQFNNIPRHSGTGLKSSNIVPFMLGGFLLPTLGAIGGFLEDLSNEGIGYFKNRTGYGQSKSHHYWHQGMEAIDTRRISAAMKKTEHQFTKAAWDIYNDIPNRRKLGKQNLISELITSGNFSSLDKFDSPLAAFAGVLLSPFAAFGHGAEEGSTLGYKTLSKVGVPLGLLGGLVGGAVGAGAGAAIGTMSSATALAKPILRYTGLAAFAVLALIFEGARIASGDGEDGGRGLIDMILHPAKPLSFMSNRVNKLGQLISKIIHKDLTFATTDPNSGSSGSGDPRADSSQPSSLVSPSLGQMSSATPPSSSSPFSENTQGTGTASGGSSDVPTRSKSPLFHLKQSQDKAKEKELKRLNKLFDTFLDDNFDRMSSRKMIDSEGEQAAYLGAAQALGLDQAGILRAFKEAETKNDNSNLDWKTDDKYRRKLAIRLGFMSYTDTGISRELFENKFKEMKEVMAGLRNYRASHQDMQILNKIDDYLKMPSVFDLNSDLKKEILEIRKDIIMYSSTKEDKSIEDKQQKLFKKLVELRGLIGEDSSDRKDINSILSDMSRHFFFINADFLDDMAKTSSPSELNSPSFTPDSSKPLDEFFTDLRLKQKNRFQVHIDRELSKYGDGEYSSIVWGRSYDTNNVIRRIVRHQEKERRLSQKYKSDPNWFSDELNEYYNKESKKSPNVLDIHSDMLRGGIDAGQSYASTVSAVKSKVGAAAAAGLGAVAGFGWGGYLGISHALGASRSGLEDAVEQESWNLLPEVMSDSAQETMLNAGIGASVGAAVGIPSGPLYGLGAVAAGGVAAVTVGAVVGAVKYSKGFFKFETLKARTLNSFSELKSGLAYLARPIAEDFGFSTTTDTHYSYQKSQDLMAQRREQLRRGEKIEDNSPIISSLIYDYNLQQSQTNIDYLDGQHTATEFLSHKNLKSEHTKKYYENIERYHAHLMSVISFDYEQDILANKGQDVTEMGNSVVFYLDSFLGKLKDSLGEKADEVFSDVLSKIQESTPSIYQRIIQKINEKHLMLPNINRYRNQSLDPSSDSAFNQRFINILNGNYEFVEDRVDGENAFWISNTHRRVLIQDGEIGLDQSNEIVQLDNLYSLADIIKKLNSGKIVSPSIDTSSSSASEQPQVDQSVIGEIALSLAYHVRQANNLPDGPFSDPGIKDILKTISAVSGPTELFRMLKTNLIQEDFSFLISELMSLSTAELAELGILENTEEPDLESGLSKMLGELLNSNSDQVLTSYSNSLQGTAETTAQQNLNQIQSMMASLSSTAGLENLLTLGDKQTDLVSAIVDGLKNKDQRVSDEAYKLFVMINQRKMSEATLLQQSRQTLFKKINDKFNQEKNEDKEAIKENIELSKDRFDRELDRFNIEKVDIDKDKVDRALSTVFNYRSNIFNQEKKDYNSLAIDKLKAINPSTGDAAELIRDMLEPEKRRDFLQTLDFVDQTYGTDSDVNILALNHMNQYLIKLDPNSISDDDSAVLDKYHQVCEEFRTTLTGLIQTHSANSTSQESFEALYQNFLDKISNGDFNHSPLDNLAKEYMATFDVYSTLTDDRIKNRMNDMSVASRPNIAELERQIDASEFMRGDS